MNDSYLDGRRFEPGDEVVYSWILYSDLDHLDAVIRDSAPNKVLIEIVGDDRYKASNMGWESYRRWVVPRRVAPADEYRQHMMKENKNKLLDVEGIDRNGDTAEQGQSRTFCPNCGTKLSPGNAFCTSCGISTSPAREPSAPPFKDTTDRNLKNGTELASELAQTVRSAHREASAWYRSCVGDVKNLWESQKGRSVNASRERPSDADGSRRPPDTGAKPSLAPNPSPNAWRFSPPASSSTVGGVPTSGSWEARSATVRCTVSRSRASTAFLEWLAAYKYTPPDLLSPSLLNSARLVYIPYTQFHVEYNANYSVSVGYNHWEQHTVYDTVYENGRSRQVPRTQTRLRVDWHPYSNALSDNFSATFPDRVPQGGDFLPFLQETSFKANELMSPTSITDGRTILAVARTPEAAYSEFAKDAINRRVSSDIKRTLPGDTHRDLQYKWHCNYDSSRVYLPFWYFAWQYQGELHGALVDGRQDTRITGRLPKDQELQQSVNKAMIPFWIALGIALVLCILIGSVNLSSGLETWFYAAIAVATSAVGLLSYSRRHQVLVDARDRRKEAVAEILSSLN